MTAYRGVLLDIFLTTGLVVAVLLLVGFAAICLLEFSSFLGERRRGETSND